MPALPTAECTLGPTATLTATTAADYYYEWPHEGTWYITKVVAIPDIAVTAHASNWSKYTLTNVTQSTTIGARSYDSDDGQGDSVAGTIETLTAPTGDARRLVKGDKLKLAVTSAASGVASRTRMQVQAERHF